MRVLLLADAYAVHTIRWAKSLSEKNIEIGVFSMNNAADNLYEGSGVKLFFAYDDNCKIKKSSFRKISYFKHLGYLKQVIKEFKPDIIHAHYASSYGLLGALCNFHPFIISVWGSDVFIFPNTSLVHKLILKYNLAKADKVLSTSYIMAQETRKYTNKNIEVTPFGIDIEVFKPKRVKSLFEETDIVIGTIKDLEEIYGIEYLIQAFAIVKKRLSTLPLKLLIVGDGSLRRYLKNLVKKLGIENDTIFTGNVMHNKVVEYDNMLSVFVAVSINESFGVAVIEASACEKPVIVSNVGGLPEVVENGVTGIIVPAKNIEATANAIEKLILDEELRVKIGKAGRERVSRLYFWDRNVEQMIGIYENIIKY